MPHRSLLLIQDDQQQASAWQSFFEAEGFAVSITQMGAEAWQLLKEPLFGLVLLGASSLEQPAVASVQALRSRTRTPIIVLPQHAAQHEVICALNMGADDVLLPNVTDAELLARVNALLRRVDLDQVAVSPSRENLYFDDQRADLTINGSVLHLTSTEYRLLKALYEAQGSILSKIDLYERILHRSYSQHDRSLDMHISNIRRKLSSIENSSLHLEAVWGQGYLLSIS